MPPHGYRKHLRWSSPSLPVFKGVVDLKDFDLSLAVNTSFMNNVRGCKNDIFLLSLRPADCKGIYMTSFVPTCTSYCVPFVFLCSGLGNLGCRLVSSSTRVTTSATAVT